MSDDLEAGVRIGDFRIERRLGAGGMGIVYLARQVSLDRPVALKVLGPALNRDADIARFQREAQAVARLNHPGIAGVHYIGQDRHVCFIAMEFVEGVSLRKVIDRLSALRDPGQTLDAVLQTVPVGEGEAPEVRFDRATATYRLTPAASDGTPETGPLSPGAKALLASPAYIRRCAEIVRDAASALAHAHERGVVHRDVKPENMLLDRRGQVHLIDFGLACFFEDVTLTNTGALVGTPMYMSPEQVTGRIEVDHRTDVYSLGLVLYELLTLRRPIAAATREGVLRQVVTKALTPVSWRKRSVPREVEAVVHKAVAKDPDERYQSAAGLAADIQRHLEGRPVEAAPYRYRLDLREIAAERPGGVVVATTILFVWAALFGLLAAASLSALLLEAIGVQLPVQFGELPSRLFIGLALAYSVGGFLTGRGLLSGVRWARRTALGFCVAGYVMCISSFHHAYEVVRATGLAMDSGPAFAALTFYGVYSALMLSSFALANLLLLKRNTADWFRLATRLRGELRKQASP
jgi:serine/threonine protein kinase